MTVGVAREGGVATVTLRRPGKRNAFDRELTTGLDAALNELDDDSGVRVILLAAEGSVFSAGTDLASGSGGRTRRGGFYGVTDRRRRTPLIAVVEGPAIGGGFEVVLACDLIVASSAATFALPEVTRGLVATCGALFRAPRSLSPTIAAELLLTGDPIDAGRAHEVGLVNRLTDPGGALAEARRVAERICRSSPVAVAETLSALQMTVAGLDAVGWAATEAATRSVFASPDAAEGMRAFLEKRPPAWGERAS